MNYDKLIHGAATVAAGAFGYFLSHKLPGVANPEQAAAASAVVGNLAAHLVSYIISKVKH